MMNSPKIVEYVSDDAPMEPWEGGSDWGEDWDTAGVKIAVTGSVGAGQGIRVRVARRYGGYAVEINGREWFPHVFPRVGRAIAEIQRQWGRGVLPYAVKWRGRVIGDLRMAQVLGGHE